MTSRFQNQKDYSRILLEAEQYFIIDVTHFDAFEITPLREQRSPLSSIFPVVSIDELAR